jgi:hypothetical protein
MCGRILVGLVSWNGMDMVVRNMCGVVPGGRLISINEFGPSVPCFSVDMSCWSLKCSTNHMKLLSPQPGKFLVVVARQEKSVYSRWAYGLWQNGTIMGAAFRASHTDWHG